MDENEFVTFNVIGSRFVLKQDLFKSYPTSLFNHLIQSDVDYFCSPKGTVKIKPNEFYVQRSPDLFKIVVQFLINGQLHVPSWSCKDEILDEFSFWNITPSSVCSNCCDCLVNNEENKDKKVFTVIIEVSKKPSSVLKRKLWTFMEYPTSSIPAMVSIV